MIDKAANCNCTGCSACVCVCPVDAVTLTPDSKGFLYPKVNEEKCITCGKCLAVCPSLVPAKNTGYRQPKVYAAWNTDASIRLESTSGGVFSALAEAVLLRGGYVVGAEYDGEFEIRHSVIHMSEDIGKLRQSKYAQSKLNLIFREVKELLTRGELVLFCGTPCQSAGLQKFLVKEYKNLFCVDFICRGVISPKVYRKFLTDMHPQPDAELTRVHFKNKDYGWNRFSTKLTFGDGSSYQKDRNEDYYMRGYLRHNLYLRDCCYQCDYKTLPRNSDISLGDFWGIGNFDPRLDNEQGTSVVLVNSEKGVQLLSWAQNHLELTERTLEEVLSGNACVLNSAEMGEYRDFFFEKMEKMSFAKLIECIDRKSMKLNVKEQLLQKLSRIKQRIVSRK